MNSADANRSPVGSALAFALFAVVPANVATAAVASGVAGLGIADAVDGFVVTNLAIGVSCGLAGILIAWQRRRNPVGWLLLAAAVCHSTSGAFLPLGVLGVQRGWPEPVLRTVVTGFLYAWPWSIALFLPLALLMFPDGLLPGRSWRAVVWFAVLTSPVFALAMGADPAGVAVGGRSLLPWFVLPDFEQLAPVWTAREIAGLLVLLAAVTGLVLRYRHGGEQDRRQLLWLVLAVLAVIVVLVPWGLFGAGPVLLLLAIALVPAAITVAVLRHELLDIRLVLSRAVVYAVLSASVVAAYLGLVAGAGALLQAAVAPVVATLLIAIGFNPVRVRLQRVVERALYGDRADPARMISRMGERLAGGTEADPGDVLAAVCDALHLPYAALRADDTEHAAYGTPGERLESVPLRYRGAPVGDLIVGARPGQHRLDRADRSALELLAVPLAIAMHATALSAVVQRSREQIVAAREEERRRLRRDLHDGLGPALTGIAFQADAAANLILTDPARAADLIAQLRSAATEAISDVRRLVYALRPHTLEELGLIGALRRHAEQLDRGTPQVRVHAPDTLPPLPAAVEVAAYRIAREALTNAVRHAHADRIDVHVEMNGALEIVVHDDGTAGDHWSPGIGITSMHERAAELGGTVRAGPGPGGGWLIVRLPL